MDISECFGSIRQRFSLTEYANFFFHPVQFHFQLTDLAIKLILERLVVLLSLLVNVKLKMDYYGAGNSRKVAEKNPYLNGLNPASFPHLQSTLSSSLEVCNCLLEY